MVLYDHRGTLAALLTQTSRAVSGQRAQRLGLLAPGGTEEVHLLHSKNSKSFLTQRVETAEVRSTFVFVLTGSSLSEGALLTHGHREFWEKLCGWVVPSEEGGGIDIFSPLGASGQETERLNSH